MANYLVTGGAGFIGGAFTGNKQIKTPHVDALAAEYEGRVKVVKVNVDEEQEIAQKYSILSIPTLMIFKDGKLVDQIVGVLQNVVQKDNNSYVRLKCEKALKEMNASVGTF